MAVASVHVHVILATEVFILWEIAYFNHSLQDQRGVENRTLKSKPVFKCRQTEDKISLHITTKDLKTGIYCFQM